MWSLAVAAVLAQAPALPFEKLGSALLAAADAARGKSPADTTVLTRIEPLFERIPLGAVELWVPRKLVETDGKLRDGPRPRELADEVAGLVALERAWIERVSENSAKLREAGDALAHVAPQLAKARAFPLGVPDTEQVVACQTIEKLFFDVALRNGRSELVVVLAPTRAEFVALLGAGGLVYPDARELYWIDAARGNVFHWLDFDACVVAQGVAPEDPKEPALPGLAMFDAVATQWVVHGASHALSARFAACAPQWFGEALAIGDTISALGADETLCSGAAPPALLATLKWTVFAWVTPHASPYRGRASTKWFAKELKVARSKDGLLVLDLAREAEAFRVPVPLLGPSGEPPAPVRDAPTGAKQGFAELYRAYSTAFVHWLDTGDAQRERLLPRLMVKLRSTQKEAEFHALARQLLGKPLGASADPDSDLEGAFAASLAR